eukprot:403459_1
METTKSDKTVLLPHQQPNDTKRHKLLLCVVVMLIIICTVTMIILGFIISDRIKDSSSVQISNESTICGSIESNALISGIRTKWIVLNNMLRETNGENYNEWFNFFNESLTNDFFYNATVYSNNNTVLAGVIYNSKTEFLITGNTEMNIPPYAEQALSSAESGRGVSTNGYIECIENDTSLVKRIEYLFIHIINKNTLESGSRFNKQITQFTYNPIKNRWFIKSALIGIWLETYGQMK